MAGMSYEQDGAYGWSTKYTKELFVFIKFENRSPEEQSMKKKYTNTDVYKFLAEECRQNDALWKAFGDGIVNHTTDEDFWESLSEELDCFRICDECGKPMIEGYVVDGCDTYCSDECLHKHLTNEEFKNLYDDGNGDTYWTTWYEDSMTYINSD